MSTIAFPQPLLTLSFSRLSLSLSSNNDNNDNIIITEIEQYYPNDVYGRAKLLCCSAAHQVNVAARLRLGGKGKGGQANTTNAQRRQEHLTRADKLLQRAFAIASKEQVVAITRAHLLFEKRGKANRGEDSRFGVGDEGRRERQRGGDVMESEEAVRGGKKIFGEFDVV